MNNLKQLVLLFFIGFLLSLFAGIVGSVGFGTMVFRALLSGILFVLLAFGAVTIYNKFLLPTESLEATSTSESPNTETPEHTVDVVIDDELPDSATAPSFNLSNFVQPPHEDEESDTVEEIQTSESREPSAFQSTSLDSMTQNVTDNAVGESVEQLEVENAERPSPRFADASPMQGEEDGSELGVLPDIEALGIEEEAGDTSAADELIQDSVFAETGEVKPTMPTVPPSELGDAKEIAAAIRTALVKDT